MFAVSNPNQLQVRIDDAIGRFGEQGNPLDFRTNLTIFKNGREVASGTTTVNDPLKYGGYRFHQVAYFPNGAELRIRDVSSGNTVFDETFPLEESTAAPAVTITDASGKLLLTDTVAPTDFLAAASGALVLSAGQRPRDLARVDDRCRRQGVAARRLRSKGQCGRRTAAHRGGRVRHHQRPGRPLRQRQVDPISGQVDVSGGGVTTPLAPGPDGKPSLMLVSTDHPALSLAENAPTTVGNYGKYTFEGQRAFAGISVKRDAGAWFIWIATAMLLGGLAITFYVPRR